MEALYLTLSELGEPPQSYEPELEFCYMHPFVTSVFLAASLFLIA